MLVAVSKIYMYQPTDVVLKYLGLNPTLSVCMPSSWSVCSTIMSKFSEGLRRGAGFGRGDPAPLVILLSSRSTRLLGDWSFADKEVFNSVVVGSWFSTLLAAAIADTSRARDGGGNRGRL